MRLYAASLKCHRICTWNFLVSFTFIFSLEIAGKLLQTFQCNRKTLFLSIAEISRKFLFRKLMLSRSKGKESVSSSSHLLSAWGNRHDTSHIVLYDMLWKKMDFVQKCQIFMSLYLSYEADFFTICPIGYVFCIVQVSVFFVLWKANYSHFSKPNLCLYLSNAYHAM